MKNILKVTILFCLIIGAFVIPSFADTYPIVQNSFGTSVSTSETYTNGLKIGTNASGNTLYISAYFYNDTSNKAYYFAVGNVVYCSSEVSTGRVKVAYSNSQVIISGVQINQRDNSSNLYYNTISPGDTRVDPAIPQYSTYQSGLLSVRSYIDNPPSIYTKNPNVDEFIANTMISMGVKFDTPADALSYAAGAWDWCIDETNMETANPFDEWNIDAFVSYCNAQSNNYLNWYNGYKVSEDVTNALGEYIRQNIRSLTGLPAGVTSVTGAYLPIYHYGSGFQSGVSSPTAQTFYPAQTITYFNGEYVNETDDISTSQFLYTPADVRRFLGYPGSSPVITPSSPTGTGTITDDPNNPNQKNITINFPALDWLADAIKSILDFLRDAFTTLANLLTQLLDAILGLFSDAFAGLSDFGQGIIDFLQSVFAGLSTLLNGYVPFDLAVIIACFIALNFGIGLITFVLKGH